jgi:type IV pilus assembly protein PilB
MIEPASQQSGASTAKPRLIGQLLLAKGLISEQQLTEAREHQQAQPKRMLLGEALVDLGFVSEDQVAEALAESYNLPYARETWKITDPRALEALPWEFIERNCVLPMFQVHDRLTVAVPEPTNVFLIEEIRREAGCPVQLVVATADEIRRTLQAHRPDPEPLMLDQLDDGDRQAGQISVVEQEQQAQDLANLEQMAGQSPVVNLVNRLLYTAVQEGASDIHVEPDEDQLRVRLRVDGRLFQRLTPPAHMGPAIVSRIKIMSELDIAERRLPQDGNLRVLMDGRPIDIRVSTMPGRFGEKVVMRIIDDSSANVPLDQLDFDPRTLQSLRELVNRPNGILLVTGPTGSGKSTTLYSMLHEINTEDVNICTVEDPIEHNLVGVNQFATNERAGFTFATALRALLRQDPDVVMVGEVRDLETAKIATQAALTGHLVLSTVHTNDAPSAVIRLTNIGVEPFLVAASLRGALAQRLVRKICTHCKTPTELSDAHQRLVEEELGSVGTVYQGAGCSKCRETGYRGRTAIYELFVPSQPVVEMISNGASLHQINRAIQEEGFMPLRRHGMEKVRAGVTTVAEVVRATAS